MQLSSQSETNWLERPLLTTLPKFNLETILVVLIILITIVSRFAMLGERVMSHDEVNHVVPAYDLFQGRGYHHDPVTHGPIQFHLLAASYFLFGDSDTSARIPAALFSTAAAVFVLFGFRRYLGRAGALAAGLFFAISPYMLFYGRYTRNEGFIELFGVVMLYAILRYLEKGDRLSLTLFTLSLALHYTSKETAFIYSAQALIFFFILFLAEVRAARELSNANYRRFLGMIGLAMLLVFVVLGLGIMKADAATGEAALSGSSKLIIEGVALLIALVSGAGALFLLGKQLGWARLKAMRSFGLMALAGALVLPNLAAFPETILGFNPLDYSSHGMIITSIFVVIVAVLAVAIGLWWNPSLFIPNMVLFYALYVVFYTTMFTNGQGFFTGLVGSLGYWLSQQGVNRGSQPLYFYALLQIPIYEFLAAIGSILAVYFGFRYGRFTQLPGQAPAQAEPEPEPVDLDAAELPLEDSEATPLTEIEAPVEPSPWPARLPVLALFIFWALTSLAAYSVAGEKMPWLTVHIALPMLLAAGWGVGFLIDTTRWEKFHTKAALLAVLLVPVLLAALSATLGGLLGAQPPFQGSTLEQLQATSSFVFAVLATAASIYGITRLLSSWQNRDITRLFTLAFFALLTVLTARAAYRASFINYDQATEYLVYAHAARGPKDILAQIEEISQRTTKGKDLVVAYSNDGLYPYWWYLRDYPNKRWYTSNPTRDLRDVPVVLAGEDVFGKIDAILGDNFVMYEYNRLWWPNQDYFNLTWEKVWSAISDPKMRSAIFQIWLNRDYTEYAAATGSPSMTLESWQPSAKIRMYIRKDVISQIWNYGVAPSQVSEVEQDPYEAKMISVLPDLSIGSAGAETSQFNAPRGVAVAPDGSIFVSDSRNHRIQHFGPDGAYLGVWGAFADAATTDAPGGTFNEPWGIAVAQDGTVFVADTWNHRVQHFTAEGELINLWGYFGQAEQHDAFWGPRDIAIDSRGRVYITDTGNKRIAVFEPDGTFVTQFGEAGVDPGQFDEPVGIAIGPDDRVYVADTWNQRVQVFVPDTTGVVFTAVAQWEVSGWFGQSLDNKPFIKVSADGNVFISDPELYRVLEFDNSGNFIRGWGDYSTGSDGFGMTSGLAIDAQGRVWVADAVNNRVMRFALPE